MERARFRPSEARRRSPLGSLAGSALTAALVLAADQATKWLARTYLPLFPDRSIELVGDLLRLTYVQNRGAAFGVLQDQNAFFVVVSGVVIAVIVASYRSAAVRTPLISLALGLQLGGAAGNLIDRLRLGYVVDFIDVSIWPVFNVADSAIVIGVGLLAYHLWRKPGQSPQPASAGPEAAP